MKRSIGVELVCGSSFFTKNSYSFGFLAAVDVDRVARELDFQVLQENIEQIALCNIDMEVVSWRFYLNFK